MTATVHSIERGSPDIDGFLEKPLPSSPDAERCILGAVETRARASTPAEPDIPQWKKDRDACPLCDADGLVWDGGLSSVCGHGGKA